MSTTEINFKARVKLGEQTLPIASEIVFGDDESEDGVKNGFLFKIDYQPGDDPIAIYLGDIIGFIEEKLGAGNLANNPGLDVLKQQFGSDVNDFTSNNQIYIEVREFSVNTSTEKTLFAINVDINSTDKEAGLVSLPGELKNWIKIKNLGISFSSKTTKEKQD